MPWKYNGITIKEGKSWSDGTYKHPYNWSTAWSDADKKKFKLVWEKEEDTSFDNRFYNSKDNPKKLDDEDAKDTDGKQIYEVDGKTKVIYEGLKTIWIRQTKETANELLSKTDWQITRKTEKNTAIDSDVATYRDAVRTACDKIEKSITDCKTLSDFIKLFDVPLDESKPPKAIGKARIFDFPDEL